MSRHQEERSARHPHGRSLACEPRDAAVCRPVRHATWAWGLTLLAVSAAHSDTREGQWLPLPGPPVDYRSAVLDTRRERAIVYGSDGQVGRIWALSLGGEPKWFEIPTEGSGPTPSRASV